ncbi:MAG: dienelactone hydrolase [Candidatus Heimdallarchaeota archaeon]|nr:dienelactone hydrolase [Candidatus Heimdallarchaeota archaeon]
MKTKESSIKLEEFDQTVTTRVVIPNDTLCMLVLSHGAGVGIEHKFMVDIQQELGKLGIASFTFNFIYKELGNRPPFRTTKPIKTMIEIWKHVKRHYDYPMFVSGKSYGGRIGSMAIDQLEGANGLIFLGYPFHPPGNLEKLRTEHLYQIKQPMLFLQGTRDTLSDYEIANTFVDAHDPSTIVWLEDGDHSWKPRKKSGLTQEDLMQEACQQIKEFCLKHN